MMPVLKDRVRIFPVRPLSNKQFHTLETRELLGQLKTLSESLVRVVDVEQPVEAHVDAERDVDQVGVALLQPLVQAGQAAHQLGDVQQLLVLLQTVLLEDLAGCRHAQQVHWRQGTKKNTELQNQIKSLHISTFLLPAVSTGVDSSWFGLLTVSERTL